MTERVARAPDRDAPAVDEVVERISADVSCPVAGLETVAAREWGVDHAIAVRDPRVALADALRAAGVEAGDEVILSAFAASPTVAGVLAIDADPVFVDVDPLSYTMDVDHVSRVADVRSDVSAVVPAHVDGHPADMGIVARIARRHDLAVVEAAGSAAGGGYGGRPAGALGDVGCVRLGRATPVRLPGGGAVLLADDDEIADRLRERSRRRLSERDAATALHQVVDLTERTDERAALADRYRERLRPVTRVRLPYERGDVRHAYQRFVVQMADREGLADRLAAAGIETGFPHRPPSRLAADPSPLDEVSTLPRAERIADRVLSLPLHADLDEEDVDRVCDAVESYFEE